MEWGQGAYSGINEPITLMQYLQESTIAVQNVIGLLHCVAFKGFG